MDTIDQAHQYLDAGGVEHTVEQARRLAAVFLALDARWPDEVEDALEREAALTAALQIILGDATLEEIAQQTSEVTISRLRAARAGAIIAEAQVDTGKSSLARRAMVTRVTIDAVLHAQGGQR